MSFLQTSILEGLEQEMTRARDAQHAKEDALQAEETIWQWNGEEVIYGKVNLCSIE